MGLLPDNGLVQNNSLEEKVEEMLDRKKENNKFRDKSLNVKSKYMFSLLLNEKLEKLRDLFLEFDEDGSSKRKN